jgi:thiol:disulfide interchange protein DsbD
MSAPPSRSCQARWAWPIAGALLGGLILNLMPCVFPVIGLKVLSFTQAARGDARTARLHALTFSAGVVLSFLMLGAALLALRSAGAAAGWGFQMQSPLFVGAMALLFVLMGLNLFGVFETGVSLTRLAVPGAAATKGGRGQGGGTGLSGSFWTGVIAVLVATPCTAPFMGGAVGFTISSPPLQTMLVFAALGLGMAAPYLVLGWAPRLLRGLPRPGPWLAVFKQFLAFPMLATAAWLAWVLTLQAGAEGVLRLLMAAVLLGFAAWIYGRAQSARMAGGSRHAGSPGGIGLAAAVLAVAGTAWQLNQIGGLSPAGAVSPAVAGTADRSAVLAGGAKADPAAPSAASSDWQPWSADSVARALAQGRPVMVDFTAAWCISCQANKKLVLERQAVRRAFDANDVVLLRADWTLRDPAITAELARFGRNGVPLYLVYTSANEPPRLLPELLTVDVVLTALGANP